MVGVADIGGKLTLCNILTVKEKLIKACGTYSYFRLGGFARRKFIPEKGSRHEII